MSQVPLNVRQLHIKKHDIDSILKEIKGANHSNQLSSSIARLKSRRKNPSIKPSEREFLGEYIDRMLLRQKVLDSQQNWVTTMELIRRNERNPNFPIEDFKKKLKEKESLVTEAKEKFNTLVIKQDALANVEPKLTVDTTLGLATESVALEDNRSFFKKNKIMLIVLGFGVLSFVSFKMYKKYKNK